MPKTSDYVQTIQNYEASDDEEEVDILAEARYLKAQKKKRQMCLVWVVSVALVGAMAFFLGGVGKSSSTTASDSDQLASPSYSGGTESESFKILEAEDGSRREKIQSTIDSHSLRFKNVPKSDGYFDLGKGWCLNFAQQRIAENTRWNDMDDDDDGDGLPDGTSLCKSACGMDALCIGYMVHKNTCALISTKDDDASSGIYLANGDREYHCFAKEKNLHKKFIFRFGEIGENECPRGFTFITDEKSCHEAADFFGTKKEFDQKKYEKKVGSNKLVGCFRDSGSETIHFNDKNLNGKHVESHSDQYVCVLREELFEEKKSKQGKSGRAGPTNENVLCASSRKLNNGIKGSDDMCQYATGDGRIMISDCDRTCIQTRCEDDDACVGWEEHLDFFRPLNSIEWVYSAADWTTIEKKTDTVLQKCLERKGNANFRFLAQGGRFQYETCDDAVLDADDDICEMTYLEFFQSFYPEISEGTWRNVIAPDIEPGIRISQDCPCSCGGGEFDYADRPTKPPVPTYAPSPRKTSQKTSSSSKGDSKSLELSDLEDIWYVVAADTDKKGESAGGPFDDPTVKRARGPGEENLNRNLDPIKEKHSFKERLDLLEQGVKKLQNMLIDYYTFDPEKSLNATQIMEHAFMMNNEENFNNMEMHEDYINVITDRFIRALVYDRKFKVGTIGSSVMAGHDNCAYDAYQRQLTRLVAPVFNIAGFEFEVINAGMKGDCGDNHEMQTFCFRHTVGDDIDALHYSWTYFQHGNFYKVHERTARWAANLDKRPFMTVLSTSNCDGTKKAMRKGKVAKSDETALIEKYGPTLGFNGLCMMAGPAEGGGYKKKKKVIGDNLHYTTRGGENACDTRKKSLGVVFRNWHPGPLLFQTVADALAWLYSVAVLRAIGQISKEPKPKEKWEPYPPRHPVLDSDTIHDCVPADGCKNGIMPVCYNGEKPVFGEPSVEWIDVGHPEYPEYLNKTTYKWERFYAYVTGLIPGKEKQFDYCWHIDRCAGWRHEGKYKLMETDTGWLVFKFPKLEIGYIGVCMTGDMKGSLPGWDFMINGELLEIPEGGWKEKKWNKCIILWKEFPDKKLRKRDSHFLAMQLSARDGSKHARPDHIFGL